MWSTAWAFVVGLLRNPAVWQIVFLFIKNWFEKDQAEKEKKKAAYENAKKAVVSRDAPAITAALDGLRNG